MGIAMELPMGLPLTVAVANSMEMTTVELTFSFGRDNDKKPVPEEHRLLAVTRSRVRGNVRP
ncbi:hypothetical protein [Streptomyces sp. NPDC088847]|uniref:hypothetical protein n=1 Tax=Streptomyces sp. NPDC088847 TaxID=3365909 RepID=UPI00381A482F